MLYVLCTKCSCTLLFFAFSTSSMFGLHVLCAVFTLIHVCDVVWSIGSLCHFHQTKEGFLLKAFTEHTSSRCLFTNESIIYLQLPSCASKYKLKHTKAVPPFFTTLTVLTPLHFRASSVTLVCPLVTFPLLHLVTPCLQEKSMHSFHVPSYYNRTMIIFVL